MHRHVISPHPDDRYIRAINVIKLKINIIYTYIQFSKRFKLISWMKFDLLALKPILFYEHC